MTIIRYGYLLVPGKKYPERGGGQFCMGARITAGVLPYKNLIPVSGYFLPGTSSSRAIVYYTMENRGLGTRSLVGYKPQC